MSINLQAKYLLSLYSSVFLIVFSILMVSPSHAAQPVQSNLQTILPAAPALDASSYFLMDFNSGQPIAELNSTTRIPPASLTKIMTIYVAFRELINNRMQLSDQVMVSEKAWRTGGSRMFLEPNKPVTVEELLKGIIIQSGNDASVAMAEHISGNEETFALLMNQHAQRLGLQQTNFSNSMGLPAENHYTTARDLAILTRALISEFPEFYQWHSNKEFTYNKITQKNRNALLWRDPTVDGVKTGHTDEAGYCLVASAMRDNHRLISVVTGTKSSKARENANLALLNYGFRFFQSPKLHAKQEPLEETRIWMGVSETVSVGLENDLYITIPSRQADLVSTSLEINQDVVAPIEQGQVMGTLKVMLDKQVISEQPLIALQPVALGGLWRRLYDQGLRLIK